MACLSGVVATVLISKLCGSSWVTVVKKGGPGREDPGKCAEEPFTSLWPRKYRATCLRIVDVRGPLSCWTAVERDSRKAVWKRANCLFIRIVNCILQEQSRVYFIERKLLLKVQMFCVKEKNNELLPALTGGINKISFKTSGEQVIINFFSALINRFYTLFFSPESNAVLLYWRFFAQSDNSIKLVYRLYSCSLPDTFSNDKLGTGFCEFCLRDNHPVQREKRGGDRGT